MVVHVVVGVVDHGRCGGHYGGCVVTSWHVEVVDCCLLLLMAVVYQQMRKKRKKKKEKTHQIAQTMFLHCLGYWYGRGDNGG